MDKMTRKVDDDRNRLFSESNNLINCHKLYKYGIYNLVICSKLTQQLK